MGCNIAIDGPAGAGKSTIAKRVAKELSFIYVDTGAMYRAVALYLLRNEIDGTDAEAVADNCQSAEVSIRYENGEQVVILNGENVNQYIRTEEVGNMASKTSANPAVRAHLLNLQRNLAAKNDVVMDGRDIGTVVLPDALPAWRPELRGVMMNILPRARVLILKKSRKTLKTGIIRI